MRSLSLKTTALGGGRTIFHGVGILAERARVRAGRPAERPAPWDADALDDLAFKRPWNLLVKVARIRAARKSDKLRTGVTVIIVNWNTLAVLRDTIAAVRALSPRWITIKVVDNGSTDGSVAWLKSQDLELLALPTNAGHSIALDLALLTCATDVAVTLDSDAVPISKDWLSAVVDPIRSQDAVLAGSRSKRNFVHPMLMAVDVRAFIERDLTFQVFKMPGVTNANEVWGQNAFDTGEWMSRMVAPSQLSFVETTPNPVDGLPGMTAGNVVYHHGGVTRMAGSGLDPVSYSDWRKALHLVLPPNTLHVDLEAHP